MKLVRPSKLFQKEFKMKKIFASLPSDQIMEENLKIILLKLFFNENGISYNFSSLRTPQQNGVVERKNRSLQEMARTMLLESGLSKGFGAEAVNTTCYIQNRVFLRLILKKTPRKEENPIFLTFMSLDLNTLYLT